MGNFNRTTSRKIAREVAAALGDFAKQRGLVVEVKESRYTPETCTVTLDLGALVVDGKPREQAMFERLAPLAGLTPEHYGQAVYAIGREFTVFGIDFGSKRWPVLVRDTDGDVFRMRTSAVRGNIPADRIEVTRVSGGEASGREQAQLLVGRFPTARHA